MAKNTCLMLLISLFATLPSHVHAATCSSLDGLEWLPGEWHSKSDEKLILERWHRVSQNTFEGAGETRSRPGKQILSEESLRLVQMSGAVYYLAKVAHNEYPVAFKLSSCSAERAVFENLNHDFPKRLIYTRTAANRMTVYVKGEGDSGFQITSKRDSGK